MKKVILSLIIFITASLSVSAQSMQEAVYLKNGSIIKGIVIEQIPNESLKIQTADGSIYVYQMSDVQKIAKEFPITKTKNSPIFGSSTVSRGVPVGYRGFADLGFTIGTGDYNVERLEFSTSHGYQFNPYFYLGAGAGLHDYYDGEAFSVPLFANPRVYFLDGKVSPFLDLKIGYTVADLEGFYLNPNVGVSFMVNKRNAVNLSLGYTMQKTEAYFYDYYYSYYSNVNVGGISIKVGMEF